MWLNCAVIFTTFTELYQSLASTLMLLACTIYSLHYYTMTYKGTFFSQLGPPYWPCQHQQLTEREIALSWCALSLVFLLQRSAGRRTGVYFSLEEEAGESSTVPEGHSWRSTAWHSVMQGCTVVRCLMLLGQPEIMWDWKLKEVSWMPRTWTCQLLLMVRMHWVIQNHMTQVLLYFTVANWITYRPFTCKLFFHLQMCMCITKLLYIVFPVGGSYIVMWCCKYKFHLNNSHIIILNLHSHSVY